MQSQNLEYKMDTVFPDDPLSICGSQNEIKDYKGTNPLSETSEMINEGNIELTKAIDMVRQYNLNILIDGKNLFNENSVINEQKYKLNQSVEMVDAKKNENPSYTEVIKVKPQKFRKMQKCKKCTKSFDSVKNLQKHKLIHAEVKPYSCSYCTMKFSRKDLAEKHMTSKHEYRAKDFCEICRKGVASRYYLKIHMLRKHKIEIVSNRKNQMKEQTEIIQVGKYQLTKHEVVNRTEDIHKDSIEEKVPFVQNSETEQCIPKYEEIKVSIGENSWIREDGRKWNGRERKENIEMQKIKKLIDRKDLSLLPPPNPSEMITKRHIFDYIPVSE